MNAKCFVLLTYAFLLANCLLFSTAVKSQFYFNDKHHYDNDVLVELGIGSGAMNCLTDLGGNAGVGTNFLKDVNVSNSQFCKSFYATVMYRYIVGLRIEASLGNISGYDSILRPVAASTYGRYDRNLSFRSNIAELAMICEFHPFMLSYSSDDKFPHFSPYIVAGIGSFSFNPQANFKKSWVNLHPLHLEGQGFKEYPNRPEYSLNSICYPVGFGLKYEMGNLFVARFECNYRFTNSDYLDDASQGEYIKPELFDKYLSTKNAYLAKQLYDRHKELNPNYVLYPGQIRGQSNNNDAYFSVELKIGVTLGRQYIK